MRFFYVRDDKPIKELSIPFVEAELRACGYDADMRRLYFAQPYKLRCDNDRTLWLVPETLMPNERVEVARADAGALLDARQMSGKEV